MATNPHKKLNIIVCGVLALFVIIGGGGWFLYSRLVPPTYPLGTGLEYVGASYSGTVPFLSDSNYTASYHYSTDMTVQEVASYFKKAKVKDTDIPELTSPPIGPTHPIEFSLQVTSTDNPIDIYYYEDGSERTKSFNLKQTSKKHMVIISDEDYQTAKDSL